MSQAGKNTFNEAGNGLGQWLPMQSSEKVTRLTVLRIQSKKALQRAFSPIGVFGQSRDGVHRDKSWNAGVCAVDLSQNFRGLINVAALQK